MATQRLNLMDAVQERSWRVARSRTALVRVGVVTAANVGNAVTVRVGNATFDATTFISLTVGNVVALITDTDAWWVLGRYGALSKEEPT
jgi:hypothetical protein